MVKKRTVCIVPQPLPWLQPDSETNWHPAHVLFSKTPHSATLIITGKRFNGWILNIFQPPNATTLWISSERTFHRKTCSHWLQKLSNAYFYLDQKTVLQGNGWSLHLDNGGPRMLITQTKTKN